VGTYSLLKSHACGTSGRGRKSCSRATRAQADDHDCTGEAEKMDGELVGPSHRRGCGMYSDPPIPFIQESDRVERHVNLQQLAPLLWRQLAEHRMRLPGIGGSQVPIRLQDFSSWVFSCAKSNLCACGTLKPTGSRRPTGCSGNQMQLDWHLVAISLAFVAQAFIPPSTVRFAPVMYEDSGPATNATSAAISSTLP
jgi:hypothetical protein